MKKYSLFIFDWQDTLIDTRKGLLFDKTSELLQYLKEHGVKIGVATGNYRDSLTMMLEQLELDNYFDYTKTVSEAQAKPDPDMIDQIVFESGIEKANTIMIGDTLDDIDMAKSAGVDSVGISSNMNTRYHILEKKPTHLFYKMEELYNRVLQAGYTN